MMKHVLFTAMILSGSLALAQSTENQAEKTTVNALGQTVTTSLPAAFHVSPPMSEWDKLSNEEIPMHEREEVRNNFEREGYLEAQNVTEVDPVVQESFGTRAMRAPIVNVNGLNSSGLPPDPSGAASNDHYVQAVNTAFRVYNKNGQAIASSSTLSSLWPGSSNEGDPIVMYDRHADRWFISQFQFSPNQILIAVSQTNDPTGSYYAYSFNLNQFPDYPKYSIWWDGYYMTSNSAHTAVVFEREKMLAGDQSAQMVVLSLPSLNTGGFRSPLPADADGELPPNGTPCYFFNLEDNAFNGVSQDQIEIYEMTTDWNNTGNTQVVSSQQLSVQSFDAVFTGGFANISQPGTSQRIDAIQGVLMYRAQHMRWVGYNSIVLSHAVDLGGNRAGVRWYELRDNNDGNWAVHQQGTYAPDNTSRWMSSAAMDSQGNIGMAYSVANASTNTYPGIRYTGRLANDPLGQMTFAEETAVDGSGSQSGIDRYGDYGHLALDPDGITFWYTGEYLGNGGSARTRIFSFRLADNVGLENPYYENLDMTVINKDNNLFVDVDGIYTNEEVIVEVIGMNGQVVYSSKKQPLDSKVSTQIGTSAFQSGIYFVRIGNKEFQKAQRVLISK